MTSLFFFGASTSTSTSTSTSINKNNNNTQQQQPASAVAAVDVAATMVTKNDFDVSTKIVADNCCINDSNVVGGSFSDNKIGTTEICTPTGSSTSDDASVVVNTKTKTTSEESTIEKSTTMKFDPAPAAAAAADAAADAAATDAVATHTKKKQMMIKKKHKKTKKLTPCSVIRSMHQNYIQRVQEEQVDTLLQLCTSASEVVSTMIAKMNPKKEDEVVVGKMNMTASMIQKEYEAIYKQIQIVVQKNPEIVHGIDPITGYNALHILVGTTYSDIGYHYKLIQLLIQTSRKVSLRQQQQQQQQQQLLLASSSSMSKKTKKNIKMMNNTKRNSSSFTDNYNNDNNKEDYIGDGDAFDNENDTDFDETMTMMTTSTTTNTVGGGGGGGSGYGNGNGGDHSNSSSSFGHPLLVSNSCSTGTPFAAKDMIIPKLLLQPSIRGESVLHVVCSNPYIGYNQSNIISTTISAAGISTTGTGTIFDVLEYLLQYNPALASMTDAFHQNLPLHTLCTTVASSASLSTSKSSTTLSTIPLSSIGNKTNGCPGVTTQPPSLPKNNNNSSSSSSSSSIVVPPMEILLLLVQHYPSACSIPNSDGDLPLHLLANITCTETIIPRTRKISVIVDSKRTSATATAGGGGGGGGEPGHTDYDDDDDEIDSLQDLHLLDLDDEDDDDDDDEDDDDVDSFCNDDAEEQKKNNYKNTKNYKNDNNDKNDNSNSKNNSNSTSRHRKYTQQVVLPSDIIMSDKERIELERTEQIRYEKQLEWIQYLVHVYPDALSVRNDMGLTPLQVALTSSTKYKQLLMKQQKICTMKKKYQQPDYNPNDHHGYHNDDHCNKDHNDDENDHDDDEDDDDSSEDSDASYLWDPIIHFLSDPIGFKNMEQQQQQQQQQRQHHPHHPHHHDHHHHNQDVHDVLGASSNHHSYSTLNNSNTALDINHNSIRWDHHDHSNDPCRIGATGTGIGISSGRTGFVVGDVSGREVDDELLKIAPNPWHPDHYAINANGSNNNINNRSTSNNNNNSTKANNNRPLLRCSDHGVRGGRGGQFLTKQQSFKKQISDRKLMMMSDDYDDPLTKALQALEDASERGYHYSDMSGSRNNNRSNNYNNSFNHNNQNNNQNNNIDINMFSIDDDVSESLSAFASPSQNGRRKIATQQQRQLFRQQPCNPSKSTNSYNKNTTDEDHYINNNPPQTPNPIGSTSSNNKNGSKTPSSRSRHGSIKTNSISNNKNIDAQFEYPKDILSFSPSSSSVEGKKITSSTSNEIVGIMKSINMKSKSNTSAGADDGERDLIVGRRRSSSNSPKKIPSSAVASTETAHTTLPSRKNNTDSYGYNKNSHPQNQKYHYHHHPHNDVDAGIVKKPPPFFVNERNGLIDFSESNQSVSEHDIYND